jgi:hypothetical protein
MSAPFAGGVVMFAPAPEGSAIVVQAPRAISVAAASSVDFKTVIGTLPVKAYRQRFPPIRAKGFSPIRLPLRSHGMPHAAQSPVIGR